MRIIENIITEWIRKTLENVYDNGFKDGEWIVKSKIESINFYDWDENTQRMIKE
jgi:hypothetical protein